MLSPGHSNKFIVATVLILIMGLACTQKNPLDSTESILGNQPNLVNMKAEPDEVAAGGGISVIQVTLLDANDKPMSNGIVQFSLTGEGKLDTARATTNSKGVAQVNYYSGTKAAQFKVVATYGNSVKNVSVSVISASSGKAIILLSSSRSAIYANGVDTTLVQVQMIPEKDTEVENTLVSLSSDFGSIPANVLLDKDGKGSVILRSDTSYADTQAMVTASYGDMTARTAVPVKAVSFDISSEYLLLPADGKSTTKITAYLKQKSNGKPVANADIMFISDIGEIQSQIKTETNGKATVTFTSTSIPDTASIIAWYGEIADSLKIVFYSDNISDQRSRIKSMTAEKTEIWANPTFQDAITVEVMDAAGLPKPNATIYFSTTAGLLSHKQRVTDSEGKALVYLSGFESDFDSTATIKADLYNGTPSAEISVLLKSESYKPRYIEIRFEPPSIGVIETGQVSTTNVIASVKDTKYRLVGTNIRVFFDVIEEPGGVKVTAVTDQGVPTVDGEAKITCTAGTRSGTVRMRARLIDDPLTEENESLIVVESTKLIIHAGPPFMADRNDPNTSHLDVRARRLNIWEGQDTTRISILVGDKYKNPCDWGTAIYSTTTGGVITTQSYTNQNGIATDTLFSGSPMPTVNRYHGYDLNLYDSNPSFFAAGGPLPHFLGTIAPHDYGGDYIWNPNYDPKDDYYHVVQYIPGDCGDYERSEVPNTNTIDYTNTNVWDLVENDGIARIRCSTIGVDANGDSIYVWNWAQVIFSGPILTGDTTVTGIYLDGFREQSLEEVMYHNFINRPNFVQTIERKMADTTLYDIPATLTADDIYDEIFPYIVKRIDPVTGKEVEYKIGSGHFLFLGQSITFPVRIYDYNGNPIHCGAQVTASLSSAAPLGLSWTSKINHTGTGTTVYDLTVSNQVNLDKPKPGAAAVDIEVNYFGGNPYLTTVSFRAEITEPDNYLAERMLARYPRRY